MKHIVINPPKLPKPDVLRRLVRQGHGRNQIAAIYGVQPERVRKRLRELRLETPIDQEPQDFLKHRPLSIKLHGGRVTLPFVSMIADMEKYA